MRTRLSRLGAVGFLVTAMAVTSSVQGDTIYMQFAGSNASVLVDNVPFSNVPWLLEFAVDDTVLDMSSEDELGNFQDCITDALIVIDGVPYGLTGQFEPFPAGSSINLMNYTDTERLLVNLYYSICLQMDFFAGDGVIFPSVFFHPNDLSSASLNTIFYNVGGDHDSSVGGAVLGENGKEIFISEFSRAGSGTFSLTLTDNPWEPGAIPEPGTIALLGVVGGVGAWVRRRKKVVLFRVESRRAGHLACPFSFEMGHSRICLPVSPSLPGSMG